METSNSQEIWEATTESTHWVHVKDPREPGGWKKKKVGGRGTKKITLTVEEREFNQEIVDEEFREHDPFANGMLVRIHPKGVERGESELTDEELTVLLQVEDDDTFEAELKKFRSEPLLRRLLALAEKTTTMWRYRSIEEYVKGKYAIGKTSKVVREIYEDDAKYADADL